MPQRYAGRMKRGSPLRRPLERAGEGSEAAVGGAKDDADVVPAVVAGEHREDGRIAGFGAAPERRERGGDVGAGGPRESSARAPVAVDPALDEFGGGGGGGGGGRGLTPSR